jgi:hypothetical protein
MAKYGRTNDLVTSLVRLGISLVATAILLFPFWIWLGARALLAPEGFWQNLLVFGIGVWALGGLQILCLIGLIAVFVAIWSD